LVEFEGGGSNTDSAATARSNSAAGVSGSAAGCLTRRWIAATASGGISGAPSIASATVSSERRCASSTAIGALIWPPRTARARGASCAIASPIASACCSTVHPGVRVPDRPWPHRIDRERPEAEFGQYRQLVQVHARRERKPGQKDERRRVRRARLRQVDLACGDVQDSGGGSGVSLPQDRQERDGRHRPAFERLDALVKARQS
jgi:hypothetical protein